MCIVCETIRYDTIRRLIYFDVNSTIHGLVGITRTISECDWRSGSPLWIKHTCLHVPRRPTNEREREKTRRNEIALLYGSDTVCKNNSDAVVAFSVSCQTILSESLNHFVIMLCSFSTPYPMHIDWMYIFDAFIHLTILLLTLRWMWVCACVSWMLVSSVQSICKMYERIYTHGHSFTNGRKPRAHKKKLGEYGLNFKATVNRIECDRISIRRHWKEYLISSDWPCTRTLFLARLEERSNSLRQCKNVGQNTIFTCPFHVLLGKEWMYSKPRDCVWRSKNKKEFVSLFKWRHTTHRFCKSKLPL